MSNQKNILRYIVEFLVIVTGVTVSFWGEEYRESLQNKEEEFKALENLKIELDDIEIYCEDRKNSYEKDLGKMHFAGLPYLRVVIATRIQSEMFLFIGASMFVTGFLLYLFFRSFRVVGICLTVVTIAVIWAMGSIGAMGFNLSILMALIPPLMIVIGIPNCVFLMTKFHQEIKEHGNKVKALSRVIQKIGTATFLTNLSASHTFCPNGTFATHFSGTHFTNDTSRGSGLAFPLTTTSPKQT